MREAKKVNEAWYAVQVMTGKETEVRAKLEKLKLATMLPVQRMPERRGGTWVMKPRMALPGYIFAEAAMTPDYYAIKTVPGVMRLLGTDGPEAIPPEQLAIIALLTYEENLIEVRGGRAALGQVLSEAGARIVSADMRQRRAKVEIRLLDGSHTATLGIPIDGEQRQMQEREG